jgi:O-antigen ligase
MLNSKLNNALQYYCLILISSSLLFPLLLSNILIILLILLIFFNQVVNKSKSFKLKNSVLALVFLFTSLYLIHLVGLVYTKNLRAALFLLEKSLSVFLFPLLLVFVSQISAKRVKVILYALVISCFFACVIALVLACYNNYYYDMSGNSSVNWDIFTNQQLASFIHFHPTYLSLLITLSIFIIFDDLFVNAKLYSRVRNSLLLAISLFFIIVLILLAARIVLLAFLSISTIAICIYGFKYGNLLKAGLSVVFIVLVLSVAILKIPAIGERFKEAINYNNEYSIDKQWGGRGMRLLKWECCIDLIQDHPLLGVGTGDTQDELQKCYKEKGFGQLLFWPHIKFNAHNQYLQTFLATGVFGLLILLLCIIIPSYFAIKKANYLYLAFLSLFAISCLTESLLESNKGVVFYSFFNALFAFHSPVNKSQSQLLIKS